MTSRANDRGAAPRSRLRGNDLATFDKLPKPIVRAMWGSVVDWCPLTVARDLKLKKRSGMADDDAIAAVLDDLSKADEHEIKQLCYHWPSRFGPGTPHVQAGATVMRYDELGLHGRRGRRPNG